MEGFAFVVHGRHCETPSHAVALMTLNPQGRFGVGFEQVVRDEPGDIFIPGHTVRAETGAEALYRLLQRRLMEGMKAPILLIDRCLDPEFDLRSLRVTQMRMELEGRGLDKTGLKAELGSRLEQAMAPLRPEFGFESDAEME